MPWWYNDCVSQKIKWKKILLLKLKNFEIKNSPAPAKKKPKAKAMGNMSFQYGINNVGKIIVYLCVSFSEQHQNKAIRRETKIRTYFYSFFYHLSFYIPFFFDVKWIKGNKNILFFVVVVACCWLFFSNKNINFSHSLSFHIFFFVNFFVWIFRFVHII